MRMALSKKKLITLLIILAIVFAIPIAIFLTQKKQNIRSKALLGKANFILTTDVGVKATAGQNINVLVSMQLTDPRLRVSGVDFLVLYDKNVLDVGNIVPEIITVNPKAAFTDAPIVTSGGSFDDQFNFIRVAEVARKVDSDLSGGTANINLARITFRGRSAGSATIKFPDDNKYMEVVGTGTFIPPISLPPSPPNTPIPATITPGGPTLTPTPAPAKNARIQGRRNQVGTVTGPVTVTVGGIGTYTLANHWDTYSTADSLTFGNPYTVSTTVPTGQKAYYSICNNCIDHPDNSYQEGSQVSVTIPTTPAANYYTAYVDLYWKYAPANVNLTAQNPNQAGAPNQPANNANSGSNTAGSNKDSSVGDKDSDKNPNNSAAGFENAIKDKMQKGQPLTPEEQKTFNYNIATGKVILDAGCNCYVPTNDNLAGVVSTNTQISDGGKTTTTTAIYSDNTTKTVSTTQFVDGTTSTTAKTTDPKTGVTTAVTTYSDGRPSVTQTTTTSDGGKTTIATTTYGNDPSTAKTVTTTQWMDGATSTTTKTIDPTTGATKATTTFSDGRPSITFTQFSDGKTTTTYIDTGNQTTTSVTKDTTGVVTTTTTDGKGAKTITINNPETGYQFTQLPDGSTTITTTDPTTQTKTVVSKDANGVAQSTIITDSKGNTTNINIDPDTGSVTTTAVTIDTATGATVTTIGNADTGYNSSTTAYKDGTSVTNSGNTTTYTNENGKTSFTANPDGSTTVTTADGETYTIGNTDE